MMDGTSDFPRKPVATLSPVWREPFCAPKNATGSKGYAKDMIEITWTHGAVPGYGNHQVA